MMTGMGLALEFGIVQLLPSARKALCGGGRENRDKNPLPLVVAL
jgi:hypothetical protein